MNQTNEINQTNQTTVPWLSLSSAEQATTVLPNLERIIRGLLYVYIFSLPFPRLLFIERNGFIILLVLLVLWCAANRRHFFMRTPVDLPLVALVVWVGISVPFATDPAYSFKEFAKLLQQGLIFYVAVYFFREARERERMLWLLLGSLAIISLYGLWQFEVKPWMGSGAPGGRVYYLIQSFLSSEIWLTTYLVMLIPLCVAVAVVAAARWQRVLAAGATSLAVLCQLLTFSRAGLLALLAEAIMFAMLVRKRVVTSLVAALVASVLVTASVLVMLESRQSLSFIPGPAKLTTYNLESRFKVWSLGLAKLQESPLVGIGYGKDNFYWATKDEPEHLAAEHEAVPMASGLHNTFLDIAVGAGLPAGLAYLWLMWTIGKAGWQRFRVESNYVQQVYGLALSVMTAGLFVRNCFDHMWIGTMALLFWIIVALSLQPMTRPEQAQSS